MRKLTRRHFLASSATVGVGALAAFTGLEAWAQDSSSAAASDGPNDQPQGSRYGVDVYNTQEVADELLYIDREVQPLQGASKRVLVTGSTAGAGQLVAAYLLKRGHHVVAHARNSQRAADVRRDLPELKEVVVGDLRFLEETRALASQINALGHFDVIIQNAAEYRSSELELLNANSLSPYLLTALVTPPKQLSFLSSNQHLQGSLSLKEIRSGDGIGYPDTKLHMAIMALAVARLRPHFQSNAINPGWIPTWMALQDGRGARDNLREGYMTQVWLAEGVAQGSDITAEYLFHQELETRVNSLIHDESAQDQLLAAYADHTGVTLV